MKGGCAMYCLLALLCAVVGVIPMLIYRRFTWAIIQTGISWLLLWWVFYAFNISTVYPFYGWIGGGILALWFFSAIGTFIENEEFKLVVWAFPLALVLVYLFSFVFGSEMLNSSKYAAMLAPEKRVWTQDIQPKDPKHMRMVSTANALYKAKMAVADAGAIGSQFRISSDYATLQFINKELWFVIPLDYNGFSVWWSVGKCPGYILVHGEDPHRKPIVKIMEDGQKFRYMPGACFGDNLERHLRSNGYLNKGLVDENLEVDEQGKAWWVVSVFEPTIVWSGCKMLGVVIVDPVTGNSSFSPLGSIPDWVDRCVPRSFVSNYADWWGEYASGWINSWWGKSGLLESEHPNLIYGDEGQPDWVTGITSKTSHDQSLVGLVYTNSRTGRSVYYEASGGATDKAILDAVGKNSEVQYKKLHGTTPQLYNVYGTMASVVPLLNGLSGFQGVAIVNIKDIQSVAVGSDQFEALRHYQKMLSQMGQQVALEKERKTQKVSGLVERYSSEPSKSGQSYFIKLSGIPHVFFGASDLSPAKLPITKVGDRVEVEFYSVEEELVPMRAFDNLSLALIKSQSQKDVEQRAHDRRDRETDAEESKTVKEGLIKGLSEKQQKELYEKLREKAK